MGSAGRRQAALMDWLSWGILLAGSACFASFAWATRFHFGVGGKTPKGMQALSLVNLAAFAWFVYGLGARPGGHRLAPFGLCVLSVLLFWWCIGHTRRRRLALAFSPDAPAFLETSGPYRVARHPFYLAYLLFWMATPLAIPSLLSWVVLAVMAALYTLAAVGEEAKFTNGVLEGKYQTYRTQTGLFWPLPSRHGRKVLKVRS